MINLDKTTQEEQTLITSSKDIKELTSVLISFYVKTGKPFTSGEMVAKIRKFNPSVYFSAKKLGEKIRKSFIDGDYELYKFLQFSRISESGQTIFVYAPNKWSGDNYDFEVQKDDMKVVTQPATVPLVKAVTKAMTDASRVATEILTPSTSKIEELFRVTIERNGRICFPKSTVDKIKKIQKQKNGVLLAYGKNNSIVLAKGSSCTIYGIFAEEKDGRIRFKKPKLEISKKGSGTHMVKESELFIE